jgi:hypothetical protein
MSAISGLGTTFGLPNYHGELIALTPAETPLLSAAGGVNAGGGQVTDTLVEWQSYDLRNPSIRTRLEGADAPTSEERVRANITNRLQIFHEAVSSSYTKQAATGRYATLAGGAENPVKDEHSWQVMQALKQVALDVNYSFWNAVRVDPSDNTTARQMAGLLSVMTSNAVDKKAPITGASASTDTITATHDLVADDKVVFTDVGASTTIVAGRAYWVKSVSTTVSFKISATKGGAAIAVGTATVSLYPLKVANVITKDDIDALLQSVFDNGGITDQATATLFTSSGNRRALTKAYATASNAISQYNGTRNMGGLKLDTIVTDFGLLNIAVDRALPADALTVVSVEQIQPVFLSIPGKGVLFEEELAKTGAQDKTQIYGEIGFSYGNQASHGVIRGLFV